MLKNWLRKKEIEPLPWIYIDGDEVSVDTIVAASLEAPVFILKHSTRCSISSMAKNRLEKAWPFQDSPAFFLDLIKYRELSNEIADKFLVQHESPQLIMLFNSKASEVASHGGIQSDVVKDWLDEFKK